MIVDTGVFTGFTVWHRPVQERHPATDPSVDRAHRPRPTALGRGHQQRRSRG
eukprot:COSAG03_NODE_19895_length_328_cov_0.676856_1_plen_51_part_01